MVVPVTEPSPKFHLNPYGVVPHVTVPVKVIGLLVAKVQLTAKALVSGWAATVTVAEPEGVTPLASVTLVSVLVPFTPSVRLKVPVPVYGAVPQVANTAVEWLAGCHA